MDKYFLFFANCIIVKGHSSSAIYDLHRGKILELDSTVLDMFQQLRYNKIAEIQRKDIKKEDIQQYVNLFITRNLGFSTNEVYNFPKLSTKYVSSFKFVNAIVEFESVKNYKRLENILTQLLLNRCLDLQLRLFSKESIKLINTNEHIKSLLKNFRSIEIHVESNSVSEKCILEMVMNVINLDKLYVHGVLNPSIKLEPNKKITVGKTCIENYYVNSFDTNSLLCISRDFFESHNYNLGLNGKISFLRNGDIKIFPTHKKVLGSIDNIILNDLLDNQILKLQWETKNDEIQNCKDCILRYACYNFSEILILDSKFYKTTYCSLVKVEPNG